MNALYLEEKLRQEYDPIAEIYRQNDEKDAQGPDHQRVARTLEELCKGFDRPITVLELGCGTGRFFYSLKNVKRLVGIDVSDEMLKAARHPLKESEVTVEEIELKKANLYTAVFPVESFDLIYSVGVFGNGCALTPELCQAVYSWLKPGGKFFFDAIDTSDMPPFVRWRKKLRARLLDLLPGSLQCAWIKHSGWMPFFLTTQKDLWYLLCDTSFSEIEVRPERSTLMMGPGVKLECTCGKAIQKEQFQPPTAPIVSSAA